MSSSASGVDYQQFLKPSDGSAALTEPAGALLQAPRTGTQPIGAGNQPKHDATTRSWALGEQAFVGKLLKHCSLCSTFVYLFTSNKAILFLKK